MSFFRLSLVLLVLTAASPFATVHAQGARSVVRDPGDPNAAVPPVRYESAFRRYRPNAEVEVRPWREQNDNVGRIGGWRIYGREAIEAPKADGESGGKAAAPATPDARPLRGAR